MQQADHHLHLEYLARSLGLPAGSSDSEIQNAVALNELGRRKRQAGLSAAATAEDLVQAEVNREAAVNAIVQKYLGLIERANGDSRTVMQYSEMQAKDLDDFNQIL